MSAAGIRGLLSSCLVRVLRGGGEGGVPMTVFLGTAGVSCTCL